MKKVIALAGSNSKASINQQLINYTTSLMESVEVIHINLNDYDLPLYGIDRETEQGIPPLVEEVNTLFQQVDGFVVSLAEHNGSYAVVFKNLIDWLSRANPKFWNDKPMLLMSTSPGGRGGVTVLQSALTSFPFLGANVVASFALPSFYEYFENGQISDVSLNHEHGEKVGMFLERV